MLDEAHPGKAGVRLTGGFLVNPGLESQVDILAGVHGDAPVLVYVIGTRDPGPEHSIGGSREG
jgi:hypothetical protein